MMPPEPSTRSLQGEEEEYDSQEEIWGRLTDVHCHANDAFEGEDLARAAAEIGGLGTGQVCVMSSSLDSQWKTEQLRALQPHKVVPAFGLHPWFSATISITNEEGGQRIVDRRDHYRRVLTKRHPPLLVVQAKKSKLRHDDEVAHQKDDEAEELLHAWIDRHLHLLPDPTPLEHFLTDLRARLVRSPGSMMGEVGLDKLFTFHIHPRSSPSAAGSPSGQSGMIIRSKYKVLIAHQLHILHAQMSLAIELGRPVSLHCVQASTELLGLLEVLTDQWGPRFTGVPSTRNALHASSEPHPKQSASGSEHGGVNLCWHSPTVSPELIQQILRKLPRTFYFSYSSHLAALHPPSSSSQPLPPSPSPSPSSQDEKKQKNPPLYSSRARRAIQATPIDRLLLESDHGQHPATIDRKLRDIFRLVLSLQPSTPDQPNNALHLAAQIEANWHRFYSPALVHPSSPH
ncbi:hypothetical protein PCANC_06466 [Puccinia coronata f. sp. avenae]|uniref:TatD DNase family Scn1 n=1 Tax=Puccinia coronata f. sp. avenae TaxID=200324 RepID=A0A2N5VW18_9BASI|nr:hypothetical protein PCANC_06466 [Puccinia coronata f. sp. avenae]